MEKNLLFYKKEDFQELKTLKYNDGYSIESVTKYIYDNSLIEIHYLLEIIDISSISEFNNKQSITEQVIAKFDDNTLFICDYSKWESIGYDLRYVFGHVVNNDLHLFKSQEILIHSKDQSLSLHIKRLFFYNEDDYYDLESKYAPGYTIESITKFISQSALIKKHDPALVIVDISAIADYEKIQSIAEEYIFQFSNETIFICDQSNRESLEYCLRLTFNQFESIENGLIKNEKVQGSRSNLTKQKRPHKKIIDLDELELNNFFTSFNESLYGHPKFKDDFQEQINTFRVFNKLGEHKILSLFLMGESGVGKTEVARLIFNCMHGKRKLAKINFGNYSNEFSLSSLIGSARGYIGSDDGEIFMKVRDTDIGILLIDEFEKSNATLFNYFLDVLESGKMTSSLGKEIDLNGFIIVFTSNISKEDFKKRISPELRSRFDYKCIFTLLSNEDKEKYLEFRAKSIEQKIAIDSEPELSNNLYEYLQSTIDVARFTNMRDINKQIKKSFVQYLSLNQISEHG